MLILVFVDDVDDLELLLVWEMGSENKPKLGCQSIDVKTNQ